MKTFLTKLMGQWLNVLAWVAPATAGKKGFELFCTPFGARLKPHQQEFLSTATQTSLQVGDESVQVYRWGSGSRKILFLHGWQSHSFRWKNYIQALSADQYTIYSLDAPAHGQSGGRILHLPKYAHAIQVFLEQTGEVDTVVSHSLGSLASLFALFQNPSLPVNKLIITGTPGEVEEFMYYYRDTLGLSKRALHQIYQQFIQTVDHHPRYFSAPRFAEGIVIPGLIIHDQHDPDAPYHHALRIQSAWKNARLITTQGLGHNLKSKEVIQEVLHFIDNPSVAHMRVRDH
jgi:pimeloyl-ACP methyl ester carboxylesterase